MQGYLPISNKPSMEELHNGIICGAAQFLNEIEVFDEDYQWENDVTKKSFLKVAIEAVEKVEKELSCYNETDVDNGQLILIKQGELLLQEDSLGTIRRMLL